MKKISGVVAAAMCALVCFSSITSYAEENVQVSIGYSPETGIAQSVEKNTQPTEEIASKLAARTDGNSPVPVFVEGFVEESGRVEFTAEGEALKQEHVVKYEYSGEAKIEFPVPGAVESYEYIVQGSAEESRTTETSENPEPESEPDDIDDVLPRQVDPTSSTLDIVSSYQEEQGVPEIDEVYGERVDPTKPTPPSPTDPSETTAEAPKEPYKITDRFTVITNEGEIEVVIVQYPSGIIEVLKTFKKEDIVEYETGMDLSGWTYIRKELQYAIWWGRNTTNSDWKKHYGTEYRLVNGTEEASKTPASTSIRFLLGDEPYDDGKWSIMMEPYYRHYYERVVQIEHKGFDEKTQKEYTWKEPKTETLVTEDNIHDPTFYTVTVPIVCDGCPAVTICLGDSADCDCGDLNTKCDDDLEPEITIAHRSELTK